MTTEHYISTYVYKFPPKYIYLFFIHKNMVKTIIIKNIALINPSMWSYIKSLSIIMPIELEESIMIFRTNIINKIPNIMLIIVIMFPNLFI